MPMTLLSVPWRCLRILPLRCQRWPARLLKSTIDPTRLMCALSGLRRSAACLSDPSPRKRCLPSYQALAALHFQLQNVRNGEVPVRKKCKRLAQSGEGCSDA